VNRELPKQAIQRISNTGVDVLGILANQPAKASLAKQGTGYGYGYGYGYNHYADTENSPTSEKKASTVKRGTQKLLNWLEDKN